MDFKISKGLRDHLNTTGDLKTALDGLVFKIYGSPTSATEANALVPATASEAIGSATLICTVSVSGNGTGVTFDDIPVNGIMYKTSTESWSGTNASSGYPSFYRLQDPSDDGTASTSNIRCQGDVGTVGTDIVLGSAYLTLGEEQRIDSYGIGIPLE